MHKFNCTFSEALHIAANDFGIIKDSTIEKHPIKESKERVRIAIKNSGMEFPSRRIIVNLAPADVRKEGTFLDLPIAIGVLIATENIALQNLEDTIFIGELSLDGKVNRVNGILPICIEAMKQGIKKVILPSKNAKEASTVKGIEIIPVESLTQTIAYLKGECTIKTENINAEELLKEHSIYPYDFAEVKGQENIKRALEVAAARWTQLSFDWKPRLWQNNDGKALTFNFARIKL